MIYVNIMSNLLDFGFNLNDFDIDFILKNLLMFLRADIDINVGYILDFKFYW